MILDLKDEFPIFSKKIYDKPLVYLDSAATSLKPKRVIDRIKQYYTYETSNVHRGNHYLSQVGTNNYEMAREKVKDFIGAEKSEEVIFTKGTTDSINLLVHCLESMEFFSEGDEVILSEMEHHSNLIPWQELAKRKKLTLKFIPMDNKGNLNLDAFESLISPQTKFLAIVWCSNTLGTINDIQSIVDIAKKRELKIFIDAAQAVSHIKINLKKLNCDYLAFSGHKMFGPFGVGVLYNRGCSLDDASPYQYGGAIVSEVSFSEAKYLSGPQRFEAGTPNVVGVIGLAEAIDFINNLGIEKISSHDQAIGRFTTDLLSKYGFGVESEFYKSISLSDYKMAIFSFNLNGFHSSDVGEILDKKSIAIRTGHHCTQPLLKKLGLSSVCRASFSIYNNQEDAIKFVESIKSLQEFL